MLNRSLASRTLGRAVRAMLLPGLLITITIWIGRPPTAPACGPDFPSSVIYADSDVLAAPSADFDAELNQIALDAPPGCKAIGLAATMDHQEQNRLADAVELNEAISKTKLAPADAIRALDEYRDVRCRLDGYAERMASATKSGDVDPAEFELSMPENLPAEFCDYLEGLISLQIGKTDAAIAAWNRLLQRPASERPYRSVWAAFMLGRSQHDADPAAAKKAYALTRSLAAAGFKDSLGLAAASFGWEAQLEYFDARYERAIELYMLQHATGDRTAAPSLHIVCGRILEEPAEVLQRVAANALCRRVITYDAIAHGGNFWRSTGARNESTARWLDAVEATDIKNLDGADQFAWAAYRGGDMDAARRWVDRSPADSGIARWIESKLLLRAGKIDAAAESLAKAVRHLPREPTEGDHDWTRWAEPGRGAAGRASGQLGAIQLTRGHYVEAVDLLLKSDYWDDASYVAERVLTVSELTTYIDKHWPPSSTMTTTSAPEPSGKKNVADPSERAIAIRYLLARRLARDKRYAEARPYMPVNCLPMLDAYAAALSKGRDRSRIAYERAASLWEAAKIARASGMELFGTEIDPDVFEYGGNFGDEPGHAPAKPRGGASLKILAASADEQKRFNTHVPTPNQRFHYRYTAADLGWEAADLMPDNNSETALVLCTAGRWIEKRDPKAAKRFYDALVQRCRSTKLGREAMELKWFPAVR